MAAPLPRVVAGVKGVGVAAMFLDHVPLFGRVVDDPHPKHFAPFILADFRSFIEALERIMADHPTPVVMVSSLTGHGTATTLRALELGAVDFALKAGSRGSVAVRGLIEVLLEKIHMAAGANVTGLAQSESQRIGDTHDEDQPSGSTRIRVAFIASSTGGPQALRRLIPALPADLPTPVLVVQHLPAGFTARMAESLAGQADASSSSDLEHNLDAIEADDIHRMAEQPTLINLVNL